MLKISISKTSALLTAHVFVDLVPGQKTKDSCEYRHPCQFVLHFYNGRESPGRNLVDKQAYDKLLHFDLIIIELFKSVKINQ